MADRQIKQSAFVARRLVLPLAAAFAPVLAQEVPPAPASPVAPPPEEVVITGERSTMQLRLQLFEAERRTYELFNALNDEARFDISCSVQARTGSRFEQQVCRPEFEIQAERAHAQSYLDTMPRDGGLPAGSVAPTRTPMEFDIARQRPAFQRRMREIAEQHPEFLDALIEYTRIRQLYRERVGLDSAE